MRIEIADPQIAETLNRQFRQMGLSDSSIWQSPIAKLLLADIKDITIFGNNAEGKKTEPEKLISQMSYTHLVQLLSVNSKEKRFFYESECIKGNWSVSELKKQINTLYFERSGMSLSPEKLRIEPDGKTEKLQITDILKSPFTFEFLGLKAKEVVYENELEQALVDNLEAFLIELGHGFCFEAKQKRITIGEEYYFIDLVFITVFSNVMY